MEKLTKRKAFNFLRSYFDVLNKIEKKEDKFDFLISIINKQFLDQDPKELNFLVDLCYSSQKHAIESSVKGWKRVNKTDLIGNPTTNPMTNPPTNPMTNPKEEEVEEKEKVEVEDETINNIFLEHRKKYKVYANQLFKDSIFVESICKEFLKVDNKEVRSLTLRKYLGLFLNSLDQSKKIHNNKKEFQQHFPHWMRKQPAIVKEHPKQKNPYEGQY
jgi:hypothetical protein